MFRKFWPFLAAIILVFTVFLVLFMKTNVTYTVEVPFPMANALEQMRDTRKISQWTEPFSTDKENKLILGSQSLILGMDTLQIIHQGFGDMKFRRSNGNDSLIYLIEGDPVSDSVKKTNFTLSFTTTPWKKYTGKNPLVTEALKNMDAFRDFMKNPTKVYGYHIIDTTVTDTLFLFASRTIPTEKFAAETKSLFDMLIAEATKRNADYNGVRIFHFSQNGDATSSLFAGIGINRLINTSNSDIVSIKIMPYKKKLLIADFEGPYKNIHKVYEAIVMYMEDNKRISMANPFHKYISDGYGFSDTQVVKMRVSFPVF
jgi:effector-binding domain-containing protein